VSTPGKRARGGSVLSAASLVLALGLGASGCADSRLAYAEESVRVSAVALAEAETAGGDTPALEQPLALVTARLAEAEHAIEVWRDHSGPLAYRTRAPCLRASLIALRDAMLAVSLEVPSALDEADALLEDVGGSCDGRPRVTAATP
jgi:hypothetical protein